jgi:hypothetical protein
VKVLVVQVLHRAEALGKAVDRGEVGVVLEEASGVPADFADLLQTRVDLYRMTFADSNIVQLTHTTSPQGAFLPAVSPDSGQIVYGFTENISGSPFVSQLRIMNIDGSDDHLLVADGRRASWRRGCQV